MVPAVFALILALVLTKFSSVWQKYIKIVNDGVTFTDTGGAVNCLVRRFLAKFQPLFLQNGI